MANVSLSRFEIAMGAESSKIQGLRVGDVVMRKYYDNTTQFYSLLLVERIGNTPTKGDYFIGKLLDGDEPGSTGDELLDFVRVTNLFDEDRMGALYMTGSESGAPFMDVIDALGKESSIFWFNGLGYNGSETQNVALYGSETFTQQDRVHKIVKNATTTPSVWSYKLQYNLSGEASLVVGKQYIASYRYRSNRPLSISSSVSKQDGTNQNDSWIDEYTTSWKYQSRVFECEHSDADTVFHSYLGTGAMEDGDWVQISDFTIIPVEAITARVTDIKVRHGKLDGVVDKTFGALKGYGTYVKRLYATEDVNVAGTLVAGDKGGIGTTFYAGKIKKNLVRHSEDITNSYWVKENVSGTVTNESDIKLPNNQLGSASRLNLSSGYVYSNRVDDEINTANKTVTFSAWVRAVSGNVSDYEICVWNYNGKNPGKAACDVQDLTTQWKRMSVTYKFQEDETSNIFAVQMSGHNADVYVWGVQVEEGEHATPYQPTDGVLSDSEDYGMWAARGGFGGTIQNPLLKLQGDGTIVGGDDKLILHPDGSAEFSGDVVIKGSDGADLNVEEAINTAKTEAINESSTNTNDAIQDLKDNHLGDLAVLDTLDGGKITDNTINLAKLGDTVISGGFIKTGLLDADAIKADIINVNYLQGLTLDFTRGYIGGWIIDDNKLFSNGVEIDGNVGEIRGVGGAWKLNGDGSGQLAGGNIAWGADGSVTFDDSVSIEWKNDANLAGKIASAKMLYRDPMFKDGMNGINVYGTIGGAENVTLELRTPTFDCPNKQGQMLRIQTLSAPTTPGLGGITFYCPTYANRELLCKIIAKIPIGRSLNFNTNSLGDHHSYKWLTNNVGTGRFEEYIFYIKAGDSGSFADTGYFYLAGGNAPVTWDIAFATIYDSTNIETYATHIDDNGVYTGTVTAEQVNAAKATVLGAVTAGSFNIGSNRFRVSEDGYLQATGVNISGTINAEDGIIGGWQIDSDKIRSADSRINISPSEGISLRKTSGSDWGMIQMSFNDNDNWGLKGVDLSGAEIFKLGSNNHIAGWSFDKDTIWSGKKYGEVGSGIQIGGSDGKKWFLAKKDDDNYTQMYYNDADSFGFVGVVDGRNLFQLGRNNRIAGWSFTHDELSSDNGNLVLNNTGNCIVAKTSGASIITGPRAMMYANSDDSYGIFVGDSEPVFQAGSTNKIAGWNFDETSIYSGNVELKNNGTIRHAQDRWALNSDGSGQIAYGNIRWDAGGDVVFNSRVKLSWDNVSDRPTIINEDDVTTIVKDEVAKTKEVVDLTHLDENTWYPVLMRIPTTQVTISVGRTLEASYGVPSYAAHASGFSCEYKWTTNGHGWGTADVQRTILVSDKKWVDYSDGHNGIVAGDISQMGNSSNEFIRLRGGSKYNILIEGRSNVNVLLVEDTYSINGQTVSKQTNPPGNPITDLSTKINEDQATEITNDTIKTTNVVASNLQVNSANIIGQLSASQIKTNEITSLGAVVGGSFNLGNGKFQVNTVGDLVAKSGVVGGWQITEREIQTDNWEDAPSDNPWATFGGKMRFDSGGGSLQMKGATNETHSYISNLSFKGLICNFPGTNGVTTTTGLDFRGSVVGIADRYEPRNVSAYGFDFRRLAGVYGRGRQYVDTGAPTYGGIFEGGGAYCSRIVLGSNRGLGIHSGVNESGWLTSPVVTISVRDISYLSVGAQGENDKIALSDAVHGQQLTIFNKNKYKPIYVINHQGGVLGETYHQVSGGASQTFIYDEGPFHPVHNGGMWVPAGGHSISDWG